jgi:hypothetical protein
LQSSLDKEFESLSAFLELERLLIAKMTQKWHEDHRLLSVQRRNLVSSEQRAENLFLGQFFENIF